MTDPTIPEVTFGSLALHPGTAGDSSGYTIETFADNNWGNAKSIVTVIKSLLQDGAVAAVTGSENREASVPVRITAPTYDGLAQGEEDLMAEVNLTNDRTRGGNTLTWLPPRADAVPTVFDVIVAELAFDFDDLNENRLQRDYTLTFTCLPFARSEALTVVPALPVPPTTPTTVVIDSCDVTTGWSSSTGAVSSSGGEVTTPLTASWPAPSSGNLIRTGAVTMGATPYLVVNWHDTEGLTSLGGNFEVAVVPVTGQPPVVLPLLAYEANTGGIFKMYYKPPASIADLRVTFSYSSLFLTGGTLRIAEVSRTDALPNAGTNRERLFTVPVGGSARTQASLTVYDAGGAALGSELLVYTRPHTLAAPPPLVNKFWVAGSPRVANAVTVSGQYSEFTTNPIAFHIPATLLEEGTYALYALMEATSPVSVLYAAELKDQGDPVSTTVPSPVYGPYVAGTTAVPAALGWHIREIAHLTLPPVRVDPTSRFLVELRLQAVGATANVDEVLLCNLDTGAVSWVDMTPDAEPIAAVHINTATLAHPRPEYQVSSDYDNLTVRRSADHRVNAWGVHEFKPGLMDVFTLVGTGGSLNAQAELSYSKRWHTHARD